MSLSKYVDLFNLLLDGLIPHSGELMYLFDILKNNHEYNRLILTFVKLKELLDTFELLDPEDQNYYNNLGKNNKSTRIATVRPALNGMICRFKDEIYRVHRKRKTDNYFTVYKFVPNEGNKKNGGGRYMYVKGMLPFLSEFHALTIEEAEEFGSFYGLCCICGRSLYVEESVNRGIGPVCIKRIENWYIPKEKK